MTAPPTRPRRGASRLWFAEHPLFYFVGVLVALVVVLVSLSILRQSGPEPPVSGALTTVAGPTAPARTSQPPTGTAKVTTKPGTTTGTKPSTAATNLGTDPVSKLPYIAESALPVQARTTLAAIGAGGPYQYPPNDDVVFANREGLLPARAASFYREYTVVTPGSPDRGPRRIIKGSDGALYYTADHYASFQRIKVGV